MRKRRIREKYGRRLRFATLCVSAQTALPLRRYAGGPCSSVDATPFPLNSLIFPQLSVQQAGTLGVNSCNVDGFTPLHVAALHGHLPLATLLIRHGANVNARTNQSATPLHLACQNSHIPVSDKGEVNV